MAKTLEAIKFFLNNLVKQGRHNNPDLISWWTPQLETQVYVSPEGGFPVEEKRNSWTDGKGDTWNHIRIPYNAGAEPYWRDRELNFLLEQHCIFIGTTGWNWVNRESWFVGFDIDDITSHAPGVGIDEHQLEQVRQKAMALPYVDVIKSTGGKGLHLYIRFNKENAPKTKNHNEHSAIARALLGKMSTEVGFDFGSHLDVCGGVMWIWGVKTTPENEGHTLIKKAEHPLSADDLPANWKDHLEVLSSASKSKIRVVGYDSEGRKVDEQTALAELTSARVKYPLNEVHKAILNDLEQTGGSVVWVADHHLAQTHTKALKIVFDKWSEEGHSMRGFFETFSPGGDLGKPNCLTGDTMVITKEGVKPIRSLAGKTATVLTPGSKWVEAPFKSYGEQDVFAITLKHEDQTKVIRATADHRWFVYCNREVEVRTRNLSREHILIQEGRYDAWHVVSVKPTGKEEVFCCTVPGTGCFCLEDFIITGNCFIIPGPKGSWLVYRFGKGTAEHKLWSQDDVGWTWCRYNWQPNLRQASLALGGKEDEKEGFIFNETEPARKAVESIGAKLMLPEDNKYVGRETILRKHKDGRLIVELAKWEGDVGFDDWLVKRDRWVRIYNINTNLAEEERDYSEFDSVARSIRTPSNADAGWMIRISGVWVHSPYTNVSAVLKAVSPSSNTIEIIGTAILNQWALVNMPFHKEYPGGRQWNYGAAQFKYKPAGVEEPHHPYWDRVLSHIGSDLDKTIKETAWCKKWNIHSGRDYLTAWVACMFREPFEPLPYLFIYGDQGCGKSIFHEALSLLVTGGVVKADTALTSQGDFNGELASGVLAVIDEKNIARAGPAVYNKIKEWTTGLTLGIHKKGVDVYQQRNSLHFVQLANERDACPVIPGDTRIVVISMMPLIEEIPKAALLKELEKEAPHFMKTLMSTPMPESMTRLRLPVIETNTKESLMEMHRSPLEGYIMEHCHVKNGRYVTLKDFYEKFQTTLSPYERSVWTKGKIRQNLPETFPVGNYTGNKVCIGNISFEDVSTPENGPKFTTQGGKLKLTQKGEEN